MGAEGIFEIVGHGAENSEEEGSGAVVDAIFGYGPEQEMVVDLERGGVFSEKEWDGRKDTIGNLVDGSEASRAVLTAE